MYIDEYSNMGLGGNAQAPLTPPVTNQTVAPGAASAAFNAATRYVRLHTDAICSFKFGPPGTTAATTNARMIAGQTEYFFVVPGNVVAVIANV